MTAGAVTLVFDHRLYARQAITAAAAEFAGLAVVELVRDGAVYSVTLTPIGRAPAGLADRFANHVLARTVEAARR
ncbi:MAG TPA: HxsD-like protein [Polyangia bacterium]|jgi:hypothetical protein